MYTDMYIAYTTHASFLEKYFGLLIHYRYDQQYYFSKLNKDIKKFLSPWAHGEIDNLRFGGSIEKSVVINFVEELSYIDYVTDFKMYQSFDENDFENIYGVNNQLPDKQLIEVSHAASVLCTSESHEFINADC